MDLLSTVRKEGSRGGRGDFKWSDVQSSTHRENYLGHSLMAPVGRWQKGRDLNWYAKGDDDGKDGEDPAVKAARERREEIRKIKEAEQDALAKALGFEVQPRNANMEALGNRKEVDRVVKETVDGEDEGEGSKGIGFGAFGGAGNNEDVEERMEGNAENQDAELDHALKEYKRRHGDGEKRRRSRSRDRESRRDRGGDRHRHQRRSRSGERHRRRHSRSRSRDRNRRRSERTYDSRDTRKGRSHSPHGREEERYQHREQHHPRYDKRHRERSRER